MPREKKQSPTPAKKTESPTRRPTTQQIPSPVSNALMNTANPQSLTPADVMVLQRTIGNRATANLVGKASAKIPPVQHFSGGVVIQRVTMNAVMQQTGFSQAEVNQLKRNGLTLQQILDVHGAGITTYADMNAMSQLQVANKNIPATLLIPLAKRGWHTTVATQPLIAAMAGVTQADVIAMVNAGLTPVRFVAVRQNQITLAELKTYRGYGYTFAFLAALGTGGGVTKAELDLLIAANYGNTQPQAQSIINDTVNIHNLLNGGMTAAALAAYLGYGYTIPFLTGLGAGGGLTRLELDALIALGYGTTPVQAQAIIGWTIPLHVVLAGGMAAAVLVGHLNKNYQPQDLQPVILNFPGALATNLLGAGAPQTAAYPQWLVQHQVALNAILATPANVQMVQQMGAYNFNAQEIADALLFTKTPTQNHNDSYLPSNSYQGLVSRLGHYAKRHTFRFFDFTLDLPNSTSFWPVNIGEQWFQDNWAPAITQLMKAESLTEARQLKTSEDDPYIINYAGFTVALAFAPYTKTYVNGRSLIGFYPTAGPGVRTYTRAEMQQFRTVVALRQ